MLPPFAAVLRSLSEGKGNIHKRICRSDHLIVYRRVKSSFLATIMPPDYGIEIEIFRTHRCVVANKPQKDLRLFVNIEQRRAFSSRAVKEPSPELGSTQSERMNPSLGSLRPKYLAYVVCQLNHRRILVRPSQI